MQAPMPRRMVREDPLDYLPRRAVRSFSRRHIIYDPERSSEGLYVVLEGRVSVTVVGSGGKEVVARIVGPEGAFGETSLIRSHALERAVTLDPCKVMFWSVEELEGQIERQPRLGLALMQHVASTLVHLRTRIHTMASYRVSERVGATLLDLATALGTPAAEGYVTMPWFTHNLLADYVGTSREMVTFEMNRLRRLGLIQYSRRRLDVYADELARHLAGNATMTA